MTLKQYPDTPTRPSTGGGAWGTYLDYLDKLEALVAALRERLTRAPDAVRDAMQAEADRLAVPGDERALQQSAGVLAAMRVVVAAADQRATPLAIWVLRSPCGCPHAATSLATTPADAWQFCAGDLTGPLGATGWTVTAEPYENAVYDVRRRLGHCRHAEGIPRA